MVTSTTATGSAARPRNPSSGTSGSARDTAAAAEARKPARVMPIWMVDRNWLGSRASLATSRPCSPSRSRRRSWPSRSEIRATSLPAKAALINTSSRTSPISAQGSFIREPQLSTATGSKRGGPVPCLCMPHSRADKLRSHDALDRSTRAGHYGDSLALG